MSISKLVPLATAASALILTSCIDIREELWIEGDGSARIEATYDIPTAASMPSGGPNAIRDSITKALASSESIINPECRVSTSNDRTRIHISLQTDDYRKLFQVIDAATLEDMPKPVQQLANPVDARMSGLSINFERRIPLASAIPALQWLPGGQLNSHKLVYIVHLPQSASESNAHDCWDNDRSLMWEYSLAEAIQSDPVMQLRLPLPVPWQTMAASSTVIVAVAGGWILHRRKKRRAAA